MNDAMPETAHLIWAGTSVSNQYVAFRRIFDIPTVTGTARLRIAVDTDFVVWYNGVEAGRGQYTDFPDRKTFSTIELAGLRPGRNVLAVLAYHAGADFFSTMPTPAGMIAAIADDRNTLLVTDAEWRACEHTGWRSGPMPCRTMQTCFTSEFDARNFPADWMMPEFDDGGWPSAMVGDHWRCIGPRPIPPCRLEEIQRGTPVKAGTFRQRQSADPGCFAARMQDCDYFFTGVTPETAGADDGIFAIFDLGREEAGFIVFTLQAPAGTVVDYAHGEHLDDGIVRMRIGERNFADRCICQAGTTRHELLFHRVGARYLQLNIALPPGGRVTIGEVGVRPWCFPLPTAAEFQSDDRNAMPLRVIARRTLELCMHEHFEDCPWREQALFAYDARNQALYGYYLWGNHDFARASFDLLAESYRLRSDHLMMMCAPMRFERTIPIFSFLWVAAAWENYLYSGDDVLFRRHAPMVADMVEHALTKRDAVTGLYHTGTAPELWNFYECTPGLDHYGCRPDEFHAGYNLYMLEMLDRYVRLLGSEAKDRYRDIAAALRRAIDAAFWDETRQAYAGRLLAGRRLEEFHDHIQFLALATGVAPDERIGRVAATVLTGELQFAVLNALPYMVHAMMPISPAARRHVAATVRRVYGNMLTNDSTTLWETQAGARDFANAGSLCHAWSCLPIYYQSAIVLGVKPLAPGFRRFEVRPYADDWSHYAEGTVPTPHGPIQVHWQKRTDGLHVTVSHPAGLECVVDDYPECPVSVTSIAH